MLSSRVIPATLALLLALSLASARAARADYDTGLAAYAAGDHAAALAAWSDPALAGNAEAQFALGVMHMRGIGTERDEAAAVEYYRRAADAGFTSAQYNLGLAYYTGRGVARDPAQAMRWWQLAAEQGHAVAQYNLGALLWGGDGVVKDQARAMHWFRLARSNGNEDASSFLLTLFAPMYQELTPDTLQQVRSDSNRSIPLIDEYGLYKLGLQAMDASDYAQAFGYWEPLARDGHADSQFQVARLYELGLGVAKDFDRALTWYDRAAQQNQGDAQYRLGLYHMNESPDPNKALGFYWIQSAADNDNAEAQAYIDSQ